MQGKRGIAVRRGSALAVLAALVVAGCTSPWPERGPGEVTLTIGDASVYTRERFITDRFEDIQWLGDQLALGKSDYEQGFQGRLHLLTRDQMGFALKAVIDKVAGISLAPAAAAEDGSADGEGEDSAAGGDGDEDDDDAGDSGTPGTDQAKPAATSVDATELLGLITALDPKALTSADLDKLGGFTPSVTPIDRLNDRLAFRDAVRDRIRQHALDDVHDLSGSSLYELHFDVSVAAGDDAGQPHIIVLAPRAPQPFDPSLVAELGQVLCHKALEAGFAAKQRYDSGTSTTANIELHAEADLRGRLAGSLCGIRNLQATISATIASLDGQPQPALLATADRMKQAKLDLDAACKRIEACVGAGGDGTLRTAPLQAATWLPAAKLGELGQQVDAADASVTIALRAVEDLIEARGKLQVQPTAPEDEEWTFPADWLSTQYGDDWSREYTEENGSFTLLMSDPGSATDPTGVGKPPAMSSPVSDASAGSSAWIKVAMADVAALSAGIHSPPIQVVRDYTGIAIGFLTIAAVAERSGGSIGLEPLAPASGEAAVTWVPKVSAHTLDGQALATVLDGLSNAIRVVAISPSQQVEQHLTSAQGEIRRALSVAVAGQLGGAVAAGVDFQKLREELRRYDLIARNPLVVGYISAGTTAAPEASGKQSAFGWLVGPRLQTRVEKAAELRYRQIDAHHSVTATVVVPAHLRTLTFDVAVYRIESSGAWLLESDRIALEGGAVGSSRGGSFDVSLPGDLVSLAEGLLYQADPRTSRPRLIAIGSTGPVSAGSGGSDPPALLRIGADEKAEFVVQGKNLWRNPEVFVGGQRADEVRILPDLNGLWVRVKTVSKPVGQTDKPMRIDLLVSTSQGSDVMKGAIEVFPAQKKPGEKPSVATLAWPVVLLPKQGNQVDLALQLDPPIPSAWSQFSIRVSGLGATQAYIDGPLTNAQTIVGDKGARLGARGVVLTGLLDSKLRERVAVDLWLSASPLAERVRLTKESQELLILRQPLELVPAASAPQVVVLADADKTKPVKVKPKVEGFVAEAPAGLSSARLGEILSARRIEAGKPPATTFEASNKPGVLVEVIAGEMPAKVRITLPEGLDFGVVTFGIDGLFKTSLELVVEDISFVVKDVVLKKSS